MTYFEISLSVGDNRACIHFASRSDHCQNTANGYDFAVRLVEFVKIFFPRVLAAINRYGYCLCIIAYRAAANCENQVHISLPRDFDSLIQLIKRRVRHNAADFGYNLVFGVQNSHYLIVYTVLFD